jgi:hypothetical protein
MLAEAMYHAVRGETDQVMQALNALLDKPDVPFSGWTIPIEPLLESVRKVEGFQKITARLADRAR